MKNIIKISFIACLSIMGLFLSSCSTGTEKNEQQLVTPNVTITVTSSTENSLTVEFDVANGSSYNCAIGQASDIAAFANGTIANIKKQIPASQKEVTFDNLNPDTEYTIFAQVFSDGYTGGVKTKLASTSEASNPDLSLEILNISAGENSISLSISYGSDTRTINYAIGQASDKDAFENGSLNNIQTIETPITSTINFNNLESGKEYTVFLRANSKTNKGQVITANEKTLLLKVDIKVEPKGYDRANITFTTEGDDIESLLFHINIPGYTQSDLPFFGTGNMGEITITEFPYTHPYVQNPQMLFDECCIYYMLKAKRYGYSTEMKTYYFNLPQE